MTPRHEDVLASIILNYLVSVDPVGSRTVALHSRDNLSAATIRNTMADLEELGYLVQPHTSAGRVPSDLGYRYYVDSLMATRPLSRQERRIISRALPREGDQADLPELLERSVKVLAALSLHVGIVLAPRLSQAVLGHLEFVGLPDQRVLVVFVSGDGAVSHRVIRVAEAVPEDDLHRMSRLVNDRFAGLTLPEMRTRLLEMMSEEKALYDRLLARALELSSAWLQSSDAGASDVLVEGASHIVGDPAFPSPERMKALFRAFEDKHRLVQLLGACLEEDRPRILIGSELESPDFTDTTLITAPYRAGAQPLGVVGVLGPRRMEYGRMVTLVHSLSRLLSEALARRAGATPTVPEEARED